MNSISGIASSMHLASGALTSFAVGTQVTAHNIANVSTGDFLPQRATYATGSRGVGVAVESVRTQAAADSDAVETGGFFGGKKASGTELAREIPHLIATERAFDANAATVRAADEMLSSLLDMLA